MTRTIKRVVPVTAGKVFGAMYFVMGLVFVPIVVLPAILSPGPTASRFPLALALALPFVYGAMGFVGMAVFAWMYNVFAERLGGVQVVLDDHESPPRP